MKKPKYKLGDIIRRPFCYAELLITQIINTESGYVYKVRYIKGVLDGLCGITRTEKKLKQYHYKRISNILDKKK